MDDYVCIGRIFRMLRREQELSQFDVAYRSEINLSYYCKMERGEANPSLRKINAVLKTLSISPIRFAELYTIQKQCFLVAPQHENESASSETFENDVQDLLTEVYM